MSSSTPLNPRLQPYQALPANEFAALCAWVQEAFYEFQREWLIDPAKAAIFNKSRQIGISHTTAAVGVLWGAFHGELTTIISKGQLEATEVLEKAKRHAKVLQGLGSKMAVTGKETTTELSFASGGRIIALPSTGGRGFTGNVFLDEFAYHQRPDEVWDAAAAVTLHGGRLRVASTPNGVGNAFHDLWELANEKDSTWSPHKVTIHDAIAQGFPVDLEDCWRIAKNDPRLFDQIFNCSFLDNVDQYISFDLIDAAYKRPLFPNDEGVAYGGLDIGETRDRTVLTIVRRNGNRRWLQHIESHKLTTDDLIDELAEKAFKIYGVKRLCVDETGLGTFPAKRLRKTWGSRLEPVRFLQQSKEDLATGLYDAFAQDLALPKSYTVRGVDEMQLLREDVASIRRIITSAGNVRYDAQRTARGHADRAWSLALAIHAAGMQSAMFSALQSRRAGAAQ